MLSLAQSGHINAILAPLLRTAALGALLMCMQGVLQGQAGGKGGSRKPVSNAFLGGHERDGRLQVAAGLGGQVHHQRRQLSLYRLQAAEDMPSVQEHHNDASGTTALSHLPLALWRCEQPLMLTPLHTQTLTIPCSHLCPHAMQPQCVAAQQWHPCFAELMVLGFHTKAPQLLDLMSKKYLGIPLITPHTYTRACHPRRL